MEKSAQTIEMELAKQENRQPLCTYCKHPLDRIFQEQTVDINWKWVDTGYMKEDTDGDSEQPMHICSKCEDECRVADWDFVDEVLVTY